MKKFMLHGFLTVLVMSVIVGCGGSSGGGDDDSTKKVPSVEKFTGTIDENSAAGTEVGTLVVSNGGSPITAITLSGDGNSDFSVSTAGVITLSAGVTLDYETATRKSYALKAVATNAIGNSDEASVAIGLNDVSYSYKVVVNSSAKVAGYETKLTFANDYPTAVATEPWSVALDKSGLEATGRSVNNLAPDFNATAKSITFGAWSTGDADGVSGDIKVMTFKTEDKASQITVSSEVFSDKSANTIAGTISIENN